jgi:uncharacterized membrane protein
MTGEFVLIGYWSMGESIFQFEESVTFEPVWFQLSFLAEVLMIPFALAFTMIFRLQRYSYNNLDEKYTKRIGFQKWTCLGIVLTIVWFLATLFASFWLSTAITEDENERWLYIWCLNLALEFTLMQVIKIVGKRCLWSIFKHPSGYCGKLLHDL